MMDRPFRACGVRLFLAVTVLLLVGLPGTILAEEELTVWGLGMEGKMLAELCTRFEQANPGVKVHLQSIPWGAAHEKLVTGVVGRMTPDVCQMGTTWMAEFLAMDALEPLDAFIASSPIREEDFFPGTIESNKLGGSWYGVPWYVDTRLIFYRTDLVASAGFPVFPRTWADFQTLCRRLKDANPGCFPFTIGFADPLQWVAFLRQRGGDLLGESAPRLAGPAEAVRATFGWLDDLHTQGFSPFLNEARWDAVEAFNAGSHSITIGGPWSIWDFEQNYPQLKGKWGSARLPAELNAMSFLGGSNMVMFRTCRNRPLAWRFIEFVLSDESQVFWFDTARGLPPTRRVWDHPHLASLAALQAFREQLEEARCPPCVPEWEQMGEAISRTMDEVMTQAIPLASSPDVLEARLTKILEKEALWQPRVLRGSILLWVGLAVIMGLAFYFRSEYPAYRAAGGWRSLASPARFLLPALVILTIFRFLPIIGSFLSSLTNWNLYGVANPDKVMFVGFANYQDLWHDAVFWKALRNTLVFTGVGVPLNITLAMATALFLYRCFPRVQGFLRTAFFIPVVSTLVVVTMIWGWIYSYEFGPLNYLLTSLGLPAFDWLGDTRFALLALVVVAVWKGFGYNMVIFFVSRQAIDESLYESAAIDGATPWQQFRHITLPMMSRATTFSAVVTGIGFLQVFTEPYIMTGGGPLDATMTIVLYLYHHGFRYFRVGYAAAIAFSLFACSLVLLLIRSRLRRDFSGGPR